MTSINGKVLFVYNSYYNGRKEDGPTSNWEVTWLNSVKSYFGSDVSIFNPDFFGPDSSVESDLELLSIINRIQPKFLIMIYQNGRSWTRDFISIETLSKIKKNELKVISIWGDIHLAEQRSLVRSLAPYVTLNLCSASEASTSRLGMSGGVQYIWVPILDTQSISINDCHCDSMVSFAGSLKNNRATTIRYLKKKNIRIHVGGGEGVGTLSRCEYLDLVGHSMTLSFSGSTFESLTNARTFEAISQKSLLLEQWGTETCKLLKPYIEYVPWFSSRDLSKKIKHFQDNPEELLKISERGHLRFLELSNKNLWEMVLCRVSGIHADSYQIKFSMNLEGIPFIHRFLSIFLDSVSRNPRFEAILDFGMKVKYKIQLIFFK